MEKKKDQEQTTALQVGNEENSMLVFSSKENFENAQRMAQVLNKSTIVPKAYQGEANLANCIISLEMANRIGMSPLMVMQNLYVVHGNPGWSSKFLIAALNVSGRFSPLRYEYKGEEGKDSWGCRAWATDKSGEKLYGAWVTMEMAKKEGWYDKNGSKWQTMPELMMQYRAGAFFARTFAPEIGMGLQTAEELHDVGPQAIDIGYVDISDKVADEIKNNANGEALKMDDDTPQADNAAPESDPPVLDAPVGFQPDPSWANPEQQ